MNRGYLGAIFVTVLLVGCSTPPKDAPPTEPDPTPTVTSPVSCSPRVTTPPCGPGAAVGLSYAYQLYTHCGILWAYFDGRWWKASPPLGDGNGNPPRRWGNPFDNGQMALMTGDRARFTSETGLVAGFEALPADVREYPGQLCS